MGEDTDHGGCHCGNTSIYEKAGQTRQLPFDDHRFEELSRSVDFDEELVSYSTATSIPSHLNQLALRLTH